ncbi:hypothetical protein FRB96_003643 [Tulasnella sp. 330]|nr:hypothetical protein FRB96_003643 [Tulasnella sp. 330]
MTTLKYTIVDALTSPPFSGNPVAVIILPSSPTLPDTSAFNIAAKFNLSETAFIYPNHSKQWKGKDVLFSGPGLTPDVTTFEFETISGVIRA